MRKLTVLTLVAACGSSSPPLSGKLPASDTAYCVALGADYTNKVGTMAVIGLPSLTVLKDVLPGAVSGDPVLRAIDGKLYVVNRDDNNITIVDAATLAVERQFSTGAKSDPQDIALAGQKAYVPLYNVAGLQVWDLSRADDAPMKTIDLGSYDPDGVPEANSVVVAGGRAYVTLDLLDTQKLPQPRGKGKVVVVDTQTDQVATDLDLTYSNPYDFMFARGSTLVVATLADFSGVDGCLEQIVPGAAPALQPCLVKNSDLNGTISAIAVGPAELYLAVSASDFLSAALRRVGGDGQLKPGAMSAAGENPTDVAYAPSGHLVYSDTNAGGVRVFDLAQGKELTPSALAIGLSPASANGIVCLGR
jgi:YVTN family beta-propeller protein